MVTGQCCDREPGRASEAVGTDHAAGCWRYLGNNPTNATDPSGLQEKKVYRLKPIHRVTVNDGSLDGNYSPE